MLEDFITAKEAAVIMKRTSDYVRKLCTNGDLEGAYKFGATWIIPKSSVMNFSPKPRGFKLFWQKYRAEKREKEEKLQSDIARAIEKANRGDESNE